MTILIALVAYAAGSLLLGLRLRRDFAWAQRANDCNWRLLVLIDEAAAFVIFGLLHLVGAFPRRPTVGDTISALAWWGEQEGIAWCRPLRRAVDALFLLVGQRDHCRKAFEAWANPLKTGEAG